MRTFNLGALKVAVVFTLALAASAYMAGAAMAEQFEASTMGKLSTGSVSTQTLMTTGGKVECTKVSATSGEAALATIIQSVVFKYENCVAFGFVSVTVSPAEYELVLGEYVYLAKLMSIKTIGCEVSLPAQVMTGASYKNTTEGGKAAVEVGLTAKGIESSAAGAACLHEGHENTGTYSGKFVLSLPAGAFELQKPAAPEFSVSASRNPVTKKAGENETTITVTNLENAAKTATCGRAKFGLLEWNDVPAEVAKCAGAYAAKGKVTFKATYVGNIKALYVVVVQDEKKAVSSVVVVGE